MRLDDVPHQVQDKLLKLIPLDPRGRVMFDFEKDDSRDELELLEAEDKDKERSEHGEDLRAPADIIEEYVQTLMLLVERQPAVGPKVLTTAARAPATAPCICKCSP